MFARLFFIPRHRSTITKKRRQKSRLSWGKLSFFSRRFFSIIFSSRPTWSFRPLSFPFHPRSQYVYGQGERAPSFLSCQTIDGRGREGGARAEGRKGKGSWKPLANDFFPLCYNILIFSVVFFGISHVPNFQPCAQIYPNIIIASKAIR